ncbi:FG-GAP repeat domain-containing protein [Rudanella lutea]|uniref:FG-GAP repeat domain-containing protein n=1 Tax=Rudanella lutea TaxID=451374 RepID=UPI00037E985C|nr:VCBS repeat-containing protein [Rudanella lutea]
MRLLLCLLPLSVLAQSGPNTPTKTPPDPKFRIEVVDNQISIGYGLAIGDVDGDRQPDILMADQKEFVWYKNPGKRSTNQPNAAKPAPDAPSRWTRHVLARNLTPQDNVCLAARDLDGDGRVEIAVGAGWNPAETADSTKSGAVFYLVRPQDPTQLWEAVRLPHEVTTHRMRWARTGRNNYQLIVVPLHGLGNKNGEGRGVRIWGYEFPKNPRGRWKQHLVDSTMHLTHNFEIWEDGNTTSLIIGGKEGSKRVAWQNGAWQSTSGAGARNLPQTGNATGPMAAGIGEIRRLDGGKAIATIQPMHGNQLAIEPGVFTTAKPQTNAPVQTPNALSRDLSQGHALVCADWLGLGRDQIAVGWRNPNAEGKVGVRLFRPEADGNWTPLPLDDSVRMACEDLFTADLDNDGDLDLIASGRATLNLLIYWNERIP